MNRYRSTFASDEAEQADGDIGFVGANMRLPPNQLPPGMVSFAKNLRFNRGVAEPRLGLRKLAWSNLVGSAPGLAVRPYGGVLGAGIFSDPDDMEWILVATPGGVYRTREGNTSVAVSLPAGVTLSGPVTFVQAMGELLLFRGEAATPLILSSVWAGFADIGARENAVNRPESENPYDGTQLIPNAATALYLQNRLFVPYERDLVAVSDYLNVTRYQPVMAAFRINQGSPDKLTALVKFNETTVIVAKEASIYRVTNVYGDLSQVVLDEVTRAYGSKARKSFAQVGKDVWFLADRRGVSSITETENGKLQAVDLPVSDAIQPIIERIDWRHAGGACAAYFDNKYYLAVPLDSGEVLGNNLIPIGTSYTAGSYTLTGLVAGRTYRWTPRLLGEQLVNGATTLTADAYQSPSDFVAVATSVTLTTPYGLQFSDDFEAETGTLPVISKALINWNTLAGSVDLLGPTDGFEWLTGEGRYVQMNGYIGAPTVDTVLESKTSYTLTAGKQYRLTVRVAGGQRGVGGFFKMECGSASRTDWIEWNAAPTEYDLVVNGDGAAHKIKLSHITYPEFDRHLMLCKVTLESEGGGGGQASVGSSVQLGFVGVNTAVLVYDFLNKAWAGYDCGTATRPLMVQDWLLHTYNGVRRLFAVTADGFLNLYEEDFEDDLADDAGNLVVCPVGSELLSRGYPGTGIDPKRCAELAVDVKTWSPSFSVSVVPDGPGEEMAVANTVSKSRTNYYRPFDRTPYVTTNANDDHAEPYREDYSLVPPGDDTGALGIDPGASGIDPDLHQESRERYRVNANARTLQVRVTGAAGRTAVTAIAVSMRAGERTRGSKA